MKPVICVDFDGVLNAGHAGELGEPVPGAREFLAELVEVADVAICSARGNTRIAQGNIRWWLREHCPEAAERVHFPDGKPAAHAYLDDRAVRFEGTFPDVQELLDMRTWQENALPKIGES